MSLSKTISDLHQSEYNLKKALRNIVNVLGPNYFHCPDCCEGCQVEIHEALRTAKEALGVES